MRNSIGKGKGKEILGGGGGERIISAYPAFDQQQSPN